jgi:hypothetical protein
MARHDEDEGWEDRWDRRELDAGLHLLDRQLVDCDGRLCGKVDDLELEERPDGPPVVAAILCGPGVLGARTTGRFWPGLGRLHAWVIGGLGGGPSRIPLSQVRTITHHVELTVPRSRLDAQRGEDWVRTHLIGKLPGARREGE